MKSIEEVTMSIDELVEQSIGSIIERMSAEELARFNQTLRLHLASKDGKNDTEVESLLEVGEYIEIHRDED